MSSAFDTFTKRSDRHPTEITSSFSSLVKSGNIGIVIMDTSVRNGLKRGLSSSETEDEEVKALCVAGLQPYMTSSDDDDDDDNSNDEREGEDPQIMESDGSHSERGIVQFVAGSLEESTILFKPQPNSSATLGEVNKNGTFSVMNGMVYLNKAPIILFARESESPDADDESSVDTFSLDDITNLENTGRAVYRNDLVDLRLESPAYIDSVCVASQSTPKICEETEVNGMKIEEAKLSLINNRNFSSAMRRRKSGEAFVNKNDRIIEGKKRKRRDYEVPQSYSSLKISNVDYLTNSQLGGDMFMEKRADYESNCMEAMPDDLDTERRKSYLPLFPNLPYSPSFEDSPSMFDWHLSMALDSSLLEL
jgi:hypothetical protein